ncbi:HalOD1 output domain-containing protein [Halomarina oriensis]|uniref:Halobacterial output domain-containing protein n=1 Tax=Halomarina oriensis TaxID=671145 RepID=A0A6B0GIQ1_9EURY|nr:HalOD1 output domain-containing protein [Halomarina oriensis]MWG34510.1 hypothetical protein [Halomarina oriensis]
MTTTTADTPTDSVLLAIVEKLAAARDADPLELPPLHDYVDTDALESLVGGRTDAGRGGVHGVRFRVDDHQVSITGDGTVDVVDVEAGLDQVSTQFN